MEFEDVSTRLGKLTISRQIQLLNENWRKGKYVITMYTLDYDFPLSGYKFAMDNDYLVIKKDQGSPMLQILDRRTMKVKHEIADPSGRSFNSFKIHHNIVMCLVGTFILVFDANTGKQINAFTHNWSVCKICFGYRDLAAGVSYNGRQLIIWQMNNPRHMTYVRQLHMPGDDNDSISVGLKMDDRYIVLMLHNVGRNSLTIYCVSTQTLEIERSLSVVHCKVQYKQGVLIFIDRLNRMRLLDVVSGSLFVTIDLKPLFGPIYYFMEVKANASYLVAMNIHGFCFDKGTEVYVFDLHAIRQTSRDANVLLNHFEVPFYVSHFQLDDKQLVCSGQVPSCGERKIMVVDFAPKAATQTKRKRS